MLDKFKNNIKEGDMIFYARHGYRNRVILEYCRVIQVYKDKIIVTMESGHKNTIFNYNSNRVAAVVNL